MTGDDMMTRKRANPSGISLTDSDAAIAKGMLARGDRQHDVAAWFGVNGGRIADIATGAKFSWVAPALTNELPPPGPYLNGRAAHAAVIALAGARAALAMAERQIRIQI
jgi:hypothetical protein